MIDFRHSRQARRPSAGVLDQRSAEAGLALAGFLTPVADVIGMSRETGQPLCLSKPPPLLSERSDHIPHGVAVLGVSSFFFVRSIRS
jgi:hypothetical protein